MNRRLLTPPCCSVIRCLPLLLPETSFTFYHPRVEGTPVAEAREQVADASRRLAAEGLVLGTAGNVSQRTGDHVAITPTGAVLADLDAEQVSVIDMEGRLVEGDLEPTSELDLHLGVYRRYDAGAVVHTHAPMATALACVLEDELPCIHYQLLALGGSVRVARYETFGTHELAEAVLDALDGRTAALMANHGAIAHGPNAAAAVESSLLLEWGCTVYWRASLLGTPRVLDEAQREDVIRAVVERGYGSTRRAGGDEEDR
jgi:L-fuculose-phosphate aldolase